MIPNRVLKKISIGEGCWEWQGYCRPNGYGEVRVNTVRWYIHRYVYTETVGPIPEGLVLDHLCRNTSCCNPDHLEPVTLGENTRRGRNTHREKTTCPQGHEYDEANTYHNPSGFRQCRICNNAASARYKQRKKAGKIAV